MGGFLDLCLSEQVRAIAIAFFFAPNLKSSALSLKAFLFVTKRQVHQYNNA
jgi:hypothetical protein